MRIGSSLIERQPERTQDAFDQHKQLLMAWSAWRLLTHHSIRRDKTRIAKGAKLLAESAQAELVSHSELFA
jgi:hypothetical protein